MDFQEDIRKQQLLDKITVIRTTAPIIKESAVEPIKKSIFDEFEVADIETVEKSLNTVGDLLGEEGVNDIEKAIGHKYFKREGTKGNYTYYYTEADYKAGKSDGEKESTAPSIEVSEGGLSEIESLKIKIVRAKEQNPGKVQFLQERLKELEGKDSDKKEEKSEYKVGDKIKINLKPKQKYGSISDHENETHEVKITDIKTRGTGDFVEFFIDGEKYDVKLKDLNIID